MKKIISALLALALAVGMTFALASCGETASKKLVLGFDAEYPPYGYLDTDTNEYAGFDIDLARTVCEAIGYELELVPINWDFKDAELTAGTINCIWSGFTMDSVDDDGVNRLDKYTWSGAYSDNSIVVLVKGDAVKSLSDLAGKTVKVQAGSSGESALKEMTDLVATFKGGKYETCADYNNAFVELESEAVDALVIDVGVAKTLIADKTGYTILTETIASEQYGIAFKLGDTALRDAIWNGIQNLPATKIQEIAAKYELTDSIIIGK